jgi:hypothetical protein
MSDSAKAHTDIVSVFPLDLGLEGQSWRLVFDRCV